MASAFLLRQTILDSRVCGSRMALIVCRRDKVKVMDCRVKPDNDSEGCMTDTNIDKTPETDTPNLGGRPAIAFTGEQMEIMKVMLEEQCTDEEIAAKLKVNRSTITNHKKNDPDFLQNYEDGKARGKTSLRSLMWESAKGCPGTPELDTFNQPVYKNGKQVFTGGREPNIIMQIWLSKNILGFSDKQEICGKDGGPQIVEVRYDG